MSRDVMRQSLEALEEITVNVSDYDFGPAYEGAKNRQKKAIGALSKELAKPEQELTDWEIQKIWIAYRDSVPRYLCFARAVIKANNTKENS